LLAVFTRRCEDILRDEIVQALQTAPSAERKLSLIAQTATARVTASLRLLQPSVKFWSHIPRNAEIQAGFTRLFEAIAGDAASVIEEGIETATRV
jgi:hypothetical protein